MSRCYACCQENCSRRKCDCSCHGDNKPKEGISPKINEGKEKAWRAYVAGFMKMLNKQAFNRLNGEPADLSFDLLNDKGQSEVRVYFEEWWKIESQ